MIVTHAADRAHSDLFAVATDQLRVLVFDAATRFVERSSIRVRALTAPTAQQARAARPGPQAPHHRHGCALPYALFPELTRLGPQTFSPDGRWLLTASMDGSVRVFDIPSGRLVDWFAFEKPVTR